MKFTKFLAFGAAASSVRRQPRRWTGGFRSYRQCSGVYCHWVAAGNILGKEIPGITATAQVSSDLPRDGSGHRHAGVRAQGWFLRRATCSVGVVYRQRPFGVPGHPQRDLLPLTGVDVAPSFPDSPASVCASATMCSSADRVRRSVALQRARTRAANNAKPMRHPSVRFPTAVRSCRYQFRSSPVPTAQVWRPFRRRLYPVIRVRSVLRCGSATGTGVYMRRRGS
jgi:hypothetical protein